jgi:hypothetical protein
MSTTDARRLLANVAMSGDTTAAGDVLVKVGCYCLQLYPPQQDITALYLQEPGHFALMIVQAGAYIRIHCCSMQDYFDMYLDKQG